MIWEIQLYTNIDIAYHGTMYLNAFAKQGNMLEGLQPETIHENIFESDCGQEIIWTISSIPRAFGIHAIKYFNFLKQAINVFLGFLFKVCF